MLVNPNNHALDGGPVTSEMEKEAVADLAAMLGIGEPFLGPPDLERHDREPRGAVGARELHPDKGVAFGANAHYTHARMCQVLRLPATEVAAGPQAGSTSTRSRPCARGDVGTVVLTAGTTGLGAVDRVDEASRCASGTACASTSMPRTAGSSRCSTTRPPRCARSAPPTRS